MKVYIDGKLFKGSDIPILIHLTKNDRINIAKMPEDALGIYVEGSDESDLQAVIERYKTENGL